MLWQGNVAQARACYFDVANKWGAFGSIPLTAGHSMSPVFGLRYSSPVVTAGGMLSPTEGKLHCLWLVSCMLCTRSSCVTLCSVLNVACVTVACYLVLA